MPRRAPLAAVPAALLALAVAAAPAAAAPEAAAQDQEVRDRLDRQEKRIQELERRLAEAEGRSGASPADLDAAVRRYLEGRDGEGGDGTLYDVGLVSRPANPKFRLGGYMSILYRSPDDAAKSPAFDAIRMVPQLAFEISPGIEFATEIEFERGGADASFLSGNEILVEYAEARFQVCDAFVPKAGILLLPFLRYNLYHDDPIWNLMDRPFTANGRLFKTAIEQPGVGAEGVFPMAGGGSWNYNVALTNGPDDGVTNSGFSGARQGFGTDNNDDKAFWGRLGVTPRLAFADAADFGVSLAKGAMEAAGTSSVGMTGWGIDGKVAKDRFDLIYEWAHFHYDRPASQPVATFPRQTNGGFVEVDTRLHRGFPKSESGITGPMSELILAVRYEWADLNERATGGSMADDTRAWTVGLAFRFTPKTVVRVERKEERTRFDGPGPEDLGQWVVSLSTYF